MLFKHLLERIVDKRIPPKHWIKGFPEIRQYSDYDCGAIAMFSVISFFGIDTREDKVMKALGTDPKRGTNFMKMKEYAEELKFKADIVQGMTVEDLEEYISNGIPVIMPIQAWSKYGNSKADTQGHYVVAIAYDAKNFYFEDPSLLQRGYIPKDELVDRWWDRDEKNEYNQAGLIIHGHAKFDERKFTKIDESHNCSR